MNLTTTTRMVIAITEELLREAFSATHYTDYTYEIKPIGEPSKGSDLSRSYQVSYRNFEVKIRCNGDPLTFVEITLIESFVREYGWQAMVECTDSHSVSGSYTFAGKLAGGVWQLRHTHRFAYSQHSDDTLVWDPYWLY